MTTKYSIKNIGLAILFALVLITIVSYFASTYLSIETVKTGPAFFLFFLSIFLTMIFIFAQDGRFSGSDWAVMALLTIGLVASAWVLKTYLPEIFSAFPQSTREVFSAFNI